MLPVLVRNLYRLLVLVLVAATPVNTGIFHVLGLFDGILASKPGFELSLVEHFVLIQIKSVRGNKLFNLFQSVALA